MPSTRKGADRQEISFGLEALAEEFLSERQAAGGSPITLSAYRRIFADLRSFLIVHAGSDDIRLITKQTMKAYGNRVCGFRFAQQQKRIWMARIAIFFAWAQQLRLILANPAAALAVPAAKEKKYPVYLTQQEIAKLLDAIPTDCPAGLRDRTLMELLYSSGLRAGEIRRLTLADLIFADGTARILMSKGKKDRIVPVGSAALFWLDRYIQQVHGMRLSGPLFYHLRTRTPLANNYLHGIVQKYRATAGLTKRCNARVFRHSFAIHLLENGAGIRHIQAMLGHANLKTTQKYTRIIPQELKRAHMRAHPGEYRRGKMPHVAPVRFRNEKKGVTLIRRKKA